MFLYDDTKIFDQSGEDAGGMGEDEVEEYGVEEEDGDDELEEE